MLYRWTASFSRRAWHTMAAGVLVLMGVLAGSELERWSPTVDEPLHLVRGLAYFWAPDTRLSLAHPPLGNALAALPFALGEPVVPFEHLDGFDRADAGRVTKHYVAKHYALYRAQLMTARKVVIALTLLLGVYLYAWAGRHFGWPWGLLALAAYAFHPMVLAHGRLVTTDFMMAAASAVVVGELWCYARGGRWAHWTVGLTLGLAMAVKYSGALLVPMALGVLLLTRWRDGGSRRARVARIGEHAVVATLAAVLVVNVAYRFERSGLTVGQVLAEPVPQNHVTVPYGEELIGRLTPLGALPHWLPVPLPYTFVAGVASIRAHNHLGHRSYFAGEVKTDGWFLYFPTLLLLETPVLHWLILFGGLVAWLLRRPRGLSAEAALWATLALTWLAQIVPSSINIGVRHALPVSVALCVLVAPAARVFARLSRCTAHPLLWGGVAASLFAGAWLARPHYLGDFNVLAGGRARGHTISIVGEDWGQDLVDTATALRAAGIEEPTYMANGSLSPYELRWLGLRPRRMRCKQELSETWAVVHRTSLWRWPECFPWLPRGDLRQVVNHHVEVYWVEGR